VRDSIPEDSGWVTGRIAGGMLDVAGVDGESGPATVETYRTEWFLLDVDTLERRAEAVAVVADEVERTDASELPRPTALGAPRPSLGEVGVVRETEGLS